MASNLSTAADAQEDVQRFTLERDEKEILGWSLVGGAGLSLIGAIVLYALIPDAPNLGMDVSSQESKPRLHWNVTPTQGGLMFGVSGGGF
jgi:hypothetical protein